MTEPPPSRWKVIERGRRLEVIDTRSGTPLERSSPPGPASAGHGLRKVSFDGTSELTTRALYDDKGPRTIRIDPASARIVGLARAALVAAAVVLAGIALVWPAILLVLPVLVQDKARAPLRRRVTGWLDTVEREGS